MRCLSIRQPWLWAIEQAAFQPEWKCTENRTWAVPPAAIGTVIALHAAKAFDWTAEFPPGFDWHGDPPLTEREFHFGLIGSAARIAGCHRHDPDRGCGAGAHRVGHPFCTPWSVRGAYHWELDGIQLLAEPVPHKGTLGLRPLPDEVESAVRAQLGEK